jgi:hypothetical protein
VPYYHCSQFEHPIGRVLTGPASRGVQSRWTGLESTYSPNRVYLFKGDGDPRTLCTPSFSPSPVNVYEVEPHGQLRADVRLGLWEAVTCETALVMACVHSLRPEHDPRK